MKEQDQLLLNELKLKVEQHEQTISQLVEIIAATNRRITDISTKQDNKQEYSLM